MAGNILKFGDDILVTIQSEDELKDTLTQIHRQHDPPNPVLALIHENGNLLYLAISSQGCMANYKDASLDPPYYSSLGDTTLKPGENTIKFQMSRDGHVTEISGRNIIAFEDLLKIAISFFIHGIRPATLIEWEID